MKLYILLKMCNFSIVGSGKQVGRLVRLTPPPSYHLLPIFPIMQTLKYSEVSTGEHTLWNSQKQMTVYVIVGFKFMIAVLVCSKQQ
jgi:hypothetical protein